MGETGESRRGWLLMSRMAGCAALVALVSEPVHAQSSVCLTQHEVHEAARWIVPALVDATATRCLPFLPEHSYLSDNANVLTGRIASLPGNVDTLYSFLLKMTHGQGTEKIERSFFIRTQVNGVSELIAKRIKKNSCPFVNRALELLDPLPAENVIGLVEELLVESIDDQARRNRESGKSRSNRTFMCPA